MNLDQRQLQDDAITAALLNKIDSLENHVATTHAIQALVIETSKQSIILKNIQESLEKAESSFTSGHKTISDKIEKLENERIRPLEDFKSNLEGQMEKIGIQGGAVGAGGMGVLVGIFHLVKDYFHIYAPGSK